MADKLTENTVKQDGRHGRDDITLNDGDPRTTLVRKKILLNSNILVLKKIKSSYGPVLGSVKVRGHDSTVTGKNWSKMAAAGGIRHQNQRINLLRDHPDVLGK